MSLNILTYNPYVTALQTKAPFAENLEQFEEICMILDYVEKSQMQAVVAGEATIDDEIPTQQEIESAKKEVMDAQDPAEVLRRMFEEDQQSGFFDDDDDDDDDDDLDDLIV